MHDWSEKEFDWEGISDAAFFIGEYLRRWGRVPVTDIKEKYGTARIYCHFGWHSIHDICYPGYHYVQFKNTFLRNLCYNNTLTLVFHILNSIIIVRYHKYLYRRAYKLAIRRWPHLKQEILCGADYSDLLEGL